jgi:8-oxo-dGTP diphosphatase
VKHEFNGAYPNQRVRLTFDCQELLDPGYVLIFPFYQGRLQLTKHRERGWELPGGTRIPGEFPIQTVVREMYEETGSELDSVEPIGQYVIEAPNEPLFVKTIYVARICNMHPIPGGFETLAVELFDQPPSPEEIRTRDDYSPILKDDVYRLALDVVRGHRFAHRS